MFKFQVLVVGLLATALLVQGQGSASSSAKSESGSSNSLPKADSEPIASASSASASAARAPIGLGVSEPEPAIPGLSGNFGVTGGIPFIPGFTHGVNTGFNLNFPGLETLASLSSLMGGDTSASASSGAAGVATPPMMGGLMGPAYFPKTWLGSAFGAKGDIFFPVVIGGFFLVGLWTVLKIVLDWLVPMVAEKLDKLNRPKDPLMDLLTPKTSFLRDVTNAQLSPAVAELSRQVAECIENGNIKYGSA